MMCMFCIKCELDFYVDGAAIPLVDWDVGPSWAGLLPISNNTNETRQVRGPYIRPGGALDSIVAIRSVQRISCSSGSFPLVLRVAWTT